MRKHTNNVPFAPMLVAAVLVISGCVGPERPLPPGTDPATQEATSATDVDGLPAISGPLDDLPPEATVQIDDQIQKSGIGSYCWPGVAGEVSVCADMVGIPTATEPIRSGEALTARFAFPLSEAPAETLLRITAVTEEDELAENARGLRWWPPKPGESIRLPNEITPQVELTLDPGLYVFSVFAQWEGMGDVTYGFLVEVLPTDSP